MGTILELGVDINVALSMAVSFPGLSANCDVYRGRKSLLLLEKMVILPLKERSVWKRSSLKSLCIFPKYHPAFSG